MTSTDELYFYSQSPDRPVGHKDSGDIILSKHKYGTLDTKSSSWRRLLSPSDTSCPFFHKGIRFDSIEHGYLYEVAITYRFCKKQDFESKYNDTTEKAKFMASLKAKKIPVGKSYGIDWDSDKVYIKVAQSKYRSRSCSLVKDILLDTMKAQLWLKGSRTTIASKRLKWLENLRSALMKQKMIQELGDDENNNKAKNNKNNKNKNVDTNIEMNMYHEENINENNKGRYSKGIQNVVLPKRIAIIRPKLTKEQKAEKRAEDLKRRELKFKFNPSKFLSNRIKQAKDRKRKRLEQGSDAVIQDTDDVKQKAYIRLKNLFLKIKAPENKAKELAVSIVQATYDAMPDEPGSMVSAAQAHLFAITRAFTKPTNLQNLQNLHNLGNAIEEDLGQRILSGQNPSRPITDATKRLLSKHVPQVQVERIER